MHICYTTELNEIGSLLDILCCSMNIDFDVLKYIKMNFNIPTSKCCPGQHQETNRESQLVWNLLNNRKQYCEGRTNLCLFGASSKMRGNSDILVLH